MSKKSLFLILFGGVLILSGLIVEIISHENTAKSAKNFNSAKQADFRQFVEGKFSKKYFDITFQDGNIAKRPRLKVSYNLKGQSGILYIYTFWQKNFANNQVQVAQKAEINKFKKAQSGSWADNSFKVIGIGGKPSRPGQVFVLPYRMIKGTHMNINDLNRYKKADRYANFYYDVAAQTLE